MRAAVSLALLLLLVGLRPPPSRAAPPVVPEKTRVLFKQAQVQYRIGSFAKALGLFLKALALTKRSSIVLNIAQCHRQLRHTNEALFYYQLYSTLWAQEQGGKASPYAAEIAQHIAKLEALAARTDRAALRITSTPAGAGIVLNGRELALRTPVLLRDLAAGDYSVVLRKGPLYFRATTSLRTGQQTELVASLAPLRAKAEIRSLPSGARVSIAGKEVGVTPLTLQLPLGQHTVELQKEGRVVARRLLRVEGPAPLAVDVRLERLGMITIQSTPPGATVRLDGRGAGVTPLDLPVDPGRHRVALELAHHRGLRREVQVAAGRTVALRLVLPLDAGVARRISRRRLFRGLAWGALAVGIAGMVVGGGLATAGVIQDGEAKDRYDSASVQWRIEAAYADRLAKRRLSATGIVAASVGTAALVTAIVLFARAPAPVERSTKLGLAPAPGGATLSLGGAF